jgi:signal transduction histidine kinase
MSSIPFFKSIRFQLLLGFVELVVLIALLGAYGAHAIESAGNIVVETYDRPLMAIDFARAASLDFAEMRNVLLQAQRNPDSATLRAKLAAETKDFFDDIEVAEERLLTPRERALARDIEARVAAWDKRRAAREQASAVGLEDFDTQIQKQFDLLVEYAAESSFLERQRSVDAIGTSRSLAILATAFAILLALTTAVFLGRRIVSPLAAAATIADRIAGGELATPIPPGRSDETGRLLSSMAMMQESIRQMMAREQEQKRSAQNRLVEALETAQEGMVLLDGNETILLANTQLARFFPEFAGTLAPGIHFPAIFAPLAEDYCPLDIDGEAPKPIAWADLLRHGGEVQYHDGRWLRLSRTPIREEGSFLLFADITDMKEREASLLAAKQQAEAASEAKTRFLANMSHELRTPLNAIIGFSEIITGELFGKVGHPNYREYATDIVQSGKHLLAIINSVLDLAKSEAEKLVVELEPVPLDHILAECAKMVREQCVRAELTLSVAELDDTITVMGEPAKLRQIVLNLVSNAIKFTPEGGRVAIAVEPRPGDVVAIRVSDSGIGMRPEDIPIALAPFSQIDSRLARRYEGTGLGLALTKALVEAHRGTLVIESALERGTTVSVILPMAGAASKPASVTRNAA